MITNDSPRSSEVTLSCESESFLGVRMSKRSWMALGMRWSGLLRLLELARSKPGVLVVNYHRIGDASRTRFDRGVFSAATDEFDRQVRSLKRHFPMLGGPELDEIVHAKKPLKRLHVALTFDDGYLDNYTQAFDVLRGNGCPGIFFLVPSYVGTATVPWWDAIAFLVRNSAAEKLTLTYPALLEVPLHADREDAIYRVLQHYKRAENVDGDRFMAELKAAAGCDVPAVERRFLSWDEARAMQAGGMTLGSHTLTHRILGQLSEEEQKRELSASRRQMEEQLGRRVSMLAYPVGSRTAFSARTEQTAAALGYTTCFSYYGGTNTPENLSNTNVLRRSFEADPLLFRTQITMLSRLGKVPF